MGTRLKGGDLKAAGYKPKTTAFQLLQVALDLGLSLSEEWRQYTEDTEREAGGSNGKRRQLRLLLGTEWRTERTCCDTSDKMKE